MENIFEYSDLAYLAVPLPDDIAALHRQGRFEEELARIDHRLALTPDEPMKIHYNGGRYVNFSFRKECHYGKGI